MSSTRRRHNHRLILERAYLSGRSNTAHPTRDLLAYHDVTDSMSNVNVISFGDSIAGDSPGPNVTSSCSSSFSSATTDTVSTNACRLPVVSSCGYFPLLSSSVSVVGPCSVSRSAHASSSTTTITSTTTTTTMVQNAPSSSSSKGTSSVEGAPVNRVVNRLSSHSETLPCVVDNRRAGIMRSSLPDARVRTTQDNLPRTSEGGPLFLGYPTSSMMASSLGLPDVNFDSTMPVKGEPFCLCYESGGDSENCLCGEEDTAFDWAWDDKGISSAVVLSDHNRAVKFHPDFSSGTAAVRGTKVMKDGQHYWEVKMTTHVYGTDMMIGVGTAAVDLNQYHHTFCSFLGEDSDSWGISYSGHVYHNGESRIYTKKFGQGTVIGVHLDMWRGTMEYYMNRKPLGVSFTGLAGKALYPMACSTAARSGMKIIRCCSFSSTLQLLCCQTLRRFTPCHLSVTDALSLPPGLRAFLLNNMAWLLWPKISAVQMLKQDYESEDEVIVELIPANKRLKADVLTSDSDTDSEAMAADI